MPAFLMTFGLAKRIVLPILERWDLIVLWVVKWRLADGECQARWFRSRAQAEDFARLPEGSVVEKCLVDNADHPQVQDDIPPVRVDP